MLPLGLGGYESDFLSVFLGVFLPGLSAGFSVEEDDGKDGRVSA